jgi:hypothetical protein
MNPRHLPFDSSRLRQSSSRFRPQLEVLEDRCLPDAGLRILGYLPSAMVMDGPFSIQVSTTPPSPGQGPASPVILTVVDPLNLVHLIGRAQGTPDANGKVLFTNLSFDSVGSNLEIRATIANTKISAISNPFLVYAHATRTKDQINLYEGMYEKLEGGLPYPLSVEYIARHLAENYDASLFTHLLDSTPGGDYGYSADRAYPHLVEVMKLVKILHPGFEIMGYVPAFTDNPTPQTYVPGGWSPPDGTFTGFQNWANAWANLQTDSGAPLVDTLFLDYFSPWVESESFRDQIYGYTKSLGKHLVVNAPIYTNNFQFAIDSPYMSAGDGVLIEGAMSFNGKDHDWFGNWIPAYTINSELIWAYNYKAQGIRLFFLTTEAPGSKINPDSKAGRTGEIYAHRYGANGFTYTNSSLNNVDNTLNPVSNAYFLNPPQVPTPAVHQGISSSNSIIFLASRLHSSSGTSQVGISDSNAGKRTSASSIAQSALSSSSPTKLTLPVASTQAGLLAPVGGSLNEGPQTSLASLAESAPLLGGLYFEGSALAEVIPNASDDNDLTWNMEMSPNLATNDGRKKPLAFLEQETVPLPLQPANSDRSENVQEYGSLDSIQPLNPASKEVFLDGSAMPPWILALPFIGLMRELHGKENRSATSPLNAST